MCELKVVSINPNHHVLVISFLNLQNLVNTGTYPALCALEVFKRKPKRTKASKATLSSETHTGASRFSKYYVKVE